jgi:hypothetical protein
MALFPSPRERSEWRGGVRGALVGGGGGGGGGAATGMEQA